MSNVVCNSPEEPGISFLVINFNMAGLVYKLIENIRRHVPSQYPYEIVVADNSTDPNHRVDGRFDHAADIVMVRLSENDGFVRAVESVLDRPRYRYVVLMHPDVDFRENCLARLIEFMEEHPRAGIVSPDLFYPDGKPCKIRSRFATLGTEIKRVLNLVVRGVCKRNLMEDERLWDRQTDQEVDMTMSVCMVIRKEVLRRIGPLPRRLWTYHLNDWLGLKARAAGYCCYYLRSAQAIHYERYTDRALYSGNADSSYKTTGIPVEGRMQRDRFVFLREAHSPAKVFAFKCIAVVEYVYLMAASLPRYRSRRTAIAAYANTLKTICRA